MLTSYECLEQKVYDNKVLLLNAYLPECIKGYYFSYGGNSSITLNRRLKRSRDKTPVLAEELGHYYTTPEDLFLAPNANREKYEHKAKMWAACELVTLPKLVQAYQLGLRSKYELSEFLDITEEFLVKALELFDEKYGTSARYGEYSIFFNPLYIRKIV